MKVSSRAFSRRSADEIGSAILGNMPTDGAPHAKLIPLALGRRPRPKTTTTTTMTTYDGKRGRCCLLFFTTDFNRTLQSLWKFCYTQFTPHSVCRKLFFTDSPKFTIQHENTDTFLPFTCPGWKSQQPIHHQLVTAGSCFLHVSEENSNLTKTKLPLRNVVPPTENWPFRDRFDPVHCSRTISRIFCTIFQLVVCTTRDCDANKIFHHVCLSVLLDVCLLLALLYPVESLIPFQTWQMKRTQANAISFTTTLHTRYRLRPASTAMEQEWMTYCQHIVAQLHTKFGQNLENRRNTQSSHILAKFTTSHWKQLVIT